MLASVFGEPALVQDCVAGCHAQQQQTAFAKQLAEDRHPPVRATRCRVLREASSLRCSGSPPSSIGMAGCHAQHQQTAFAKQKRQDAVFCVNTEPALACTKPCGMCRWVGP